MILETEMLKLRPFQSDDVKAIASYPKPDFIRFLLLPPQTWQARPNSSAAFRRRRCGTEGGCGLCCSALCAARRRTPSRSAVHRLAVPWMPAVLDSVSLM